jgi:hypothetical protein
MLQMWEANTQIKCGLRKLRSPVLPSVQRHQGVRALDSSQFAEDIADYRWGLRNNFSALLFYDPEKSCDAGRLFSNARVHLPLVR